MDISNGYLDKEPSKHHNVVQHFGTMPDLKHKQSQLTVQNSKFQTGTHITRNQTFKKIPIRMVLKYDIF